MPARSGFITSWVSTASSIATTTARNLLRRGVRSHQALPQLIPQTRHDIEVELRSRLQREPFGIEETRVDAGAVDEMVDQLGGRVGLGEDAADAGEFEIPTDPV